MARLAYYGGVSPDEFEAMDHFDSIKLDASLRRLRGDEWDTLQALLRENAAIVAGSRVGMAMEVR